MNQSPHHRLSRQKHRRWQRRKRQGFLLPAYATRIDPRGREAWPVPIILRKPPVRGKTWGTKR